MHIRFISCQRATTPSYAATDNEVYNDTWLGLVIFIIGSVFLPRKF